jgi:ribonuclease P protein component
VGAKSLPDAGGKGVAASPPSDPPGSASSAKPTGRLRFPRSSRLVRRKDFEAVYRSGKRQAGRQFVVFCRRNGLGATRFGMSAGRRLGTAVVRNRIRRRIREILRLHQREIATGWDIVIQPRRVVGREPFASLETELVKLLRTLTGSRS